MKHTLVIVSVAAAMVIAAYFVVEKVRKDASIAASIKIIANSVDSNNPDNLDLTCSLHRTPYNNRAYGTKLYILGCEEKPR